ncbi:MAG TPA: DNA-processing protein DprA [Candidatus Binatia bacterium]|nr:DNA-processing protein DprA [Candidatus Binatia bacterium]
MIQTPLPLEKGAPVSGQDCAPWLALGRIRGVGGVSFKKITARFADPAAVFRASAAELAEIEGLHRELIHSIANFNDWAEIDKEIQRARAAGIKMIPFSDAAYPASLRAIADPPPLLYVKGELRDNDSKAIAIVGSRSASDYGRRIARDLARGLASFGFTVVSGMARGIDGMAHESALQAGGRTLAVLGSGVDRAYPPEHEMLYRRISDSGAVISELPMGARPIAFNFPARNRLISGLSLGVVVVEATEKSGSLITASLAAEQGREVFAVPGEAGASRSRGSHRLIRQGAKLVETVEDIIEEIAPQLSRRNGDAAPASARSLPENSGPAARQIFALLKETSLQVDQVIEQSGLPAPQVLQVLLDLELQGFVCQTPGKIYRAEK